MIKRGVTVFVVGTEESRIRSQLIPVLHELRKTCISWEVEFRVTPTFHNASCKLPAYPDVEVVHIVNDSDFSLDELKSGAQVMMPHLTKLSRKPLVNFGFRLLDDVMRPICIGHGIPTMLGHVQEAVYRRWRESPVTYMKLVG